MKRTSIVLIVLLAACGSSSKAATNVDHPTPSECAALAKQNAPQIAWDKGVAVWNALSQAARDRYDDPKPGDPGGGYTAWARANHFPTVNPKTGTATYDACQKAR